jgi:hypothetical protein
MSITSSGQETSGITPTHKLLVRPSPHNSNHRVVHPEGYPVDAPPLYVIAINKASKPNVLIYPGNGYIAQPIGDATISSISSKIQITLHGQASILKGSQLEEKYKIESSPYGSLKWKGSEFSSGYALYNDAGDKLAEYKSVEFMGDKMLKIFTQCDGYFVEYLLLTVLAARTSKSIGNEVALEVTGAIAGA